MQENSVKYLFLSVAVLTLATCTSTKVASVDSDDPTTKAISEVYIEPKLDEKIDHVIDDDVIIATGSRRRREASDAPEPIAAPEPAPIADHTGWDGSIGASPPPPPSLSREGSYLSDAPGTVKSETAPRPQSGQLTAGDYDDVLNLSLIHISEPTRPY